MSYEGLGKQDWCHMCAPSVSTPTPFSFGISVQGKVTPLSSSSSLKERDRYKEKRKRSTSEDTDHCPTLLQASSLDGLNNHERHPDPNDDAVVSLYESMCNFSYMRSGSRGCHGDNYNHNHPSAADEDAAHHQWWSFLGAWAGDGSLTLYPI